MTTRKQILERLTGMECDNTPTPERQEKSQFSLRDNVWRTRTIAERLYGSERITQDEYNSCQRWAATYVLTYDGAGTVQEGTSTAIIKHDAISFAMHMASEKDCIPEIKDRIGVAYHQLLVLSLYHCYSSAQIGRVLGVGSQRKDEMAIDRMCISAYKKLYQFYFSKKVDKRSKCGISKAQ